MLQRSLFLSLLLLSMILFSSCTQDDLLDTATEEIAQIDARYTGFDLEKIYGDKNTATKELKNFQDRMKEEVSLGEVLEKIGAPSQTRCWSRTINDMPPVKNQGGTNACGSFATSYALSLEQNRDRGWGGNYGNARQRSPWFIWSAIGGQWWNFWQLPTPFNYVVNNGCASYTQVANNGSNISNAERNDARNYRPDGRWTGNGNLDGVKNAICWFNLPVVVMFHMDDNGTINLNGNIWSNNRAINPFMLHYMTVYGYNNGSGRLLVQNSWGAGWSGDGRFEMTYAKFNRNYAGTMGYMW